MPSMQDVHGLNFELRRTFRLWQSVLNHLLRLPVVDKQEQCETIQDTLQTLEEISRSLKEVESTLKEVYLYECALPKVRPYSATDTSRS